MMGEHSHNCSPLVTETDMMTISQRGSVSVVFTCHVLCLIKMNARVYGAFLLRQPMFHPPQAKTVAR